MDNIKKTRNKSTKKQLYKEERKQFLEDLNKIINIDDEHNTIIVYSINNSFELKDFISNNQDKIKKIFNYSRWSYFIKDRNAKSEISSLIKNIYKHEKYDIFTKRVNIKNDNNIIQTTQLIFYKPGRIH
jgi:hypothetical protein